MEQSSGVTPVPASEYINAFAQHVASVCVITTAVAGRRFGLTATSVTSVTAEPPRLLACVNKSGITHKRLTKSGTFCVNVLSEGQDSLARTFAKASDPKQDRFSAGEWITLITGAPVLIGAAAAFDCVVVHEVDQSSHTVFFGEVVATCEQGGRDSLLYGTRRFRQLRRSLAALDPDAREDL